MYETYYGKLQPFCGVKNIQLHYIDAESFVITIKTKNFYQRLKKDFFDFSNLSDNHELFSNKNKKVLGNFQKETPKTIWIDEFFCLRSKMYAFACGDDSKNKLKGICKSQSKNIKFDEYKNCLVGSKYQKVCDNYLLRSLNHEMYFQLLEKSTLSIFDDIRCFEINIKSKLWG